MAKYAFEHLGLNIWGWTFGNALMITALKEIFMGRRELFEGLAISKTDWKWEKWPPPPRDGYDEGIL